MRFADATIPMPRFVTERSMIMYDEVDDDVAMHAEWSDIDLDVILDSGCSDHVMNVELDAHGYRVEPSEKSRQGRGFMVGNGERVACEGEAALNLRSVDDSGRTIDFQSVFQAAAVTHPLMSVSKVCKNGYTCQFTDDSALILDKDGQQVLKFEKKNGLYVGRMKLRQPSPFGRQA